MLACKNIPISLYVRVRRAAFFGVSHEWWRLRCEQGASLAACGHMYLDQGEELEVGTAANNLLSFSAALVPSANTTLGQVRKFLPPNLCMHRLFTRTAAYHDMQHAHFPQLSNEYWLFLLDCWYFTTGCGSWWDCCI